MEGIKIFRYKDIYAILFDELDIGFHVAEIERGEIINGNFQKTDSFFTRYRPGTSIGDCLVDNTGYLGATLKGARNELIKRLKKDVDDPVVSKTDLYIKTVNDLYNKMESERLKDVRMYVGGEN